MSPFRIYTTFLFVCYFCAVSAYAAEPVFKRHFIRENPPWLTSTHQTILTDIDNDGDWDVFSAVGPLAKGEKRTYLFESLSGRGKKPTAWKEHIILSGPLYHEGIAGDVDSDGDVDLIVKGWTSGSFIYLENLLEKKQ